MRVGELRHSVTIQAPIGVLDEVASVDVASAVPAKIEVLPAQFQQREVLATGGLRSQTVYTLTMRYREDVRPSYVVNEECCTERQFQILSVIPSDKRDALYLTCVTNG